MKNKNKSENNFIEGTFELSYASHFVICKSLKFV